MTYDRLGPAQINYQLCRYPGSKLLFRGPQRQLSGDYIAFLGGTETYGKFIPYPFPALVEQRTGIQCINLGWSNAGGDVYLNDPGVTAMTEQAQLTILQVPSAQNMSNRYYRVHPRRNDRFVQASRTLRALYSDVDFTEIHYTRHLLHRLQTQCPTRFELLRKELTIAWISRMGALLDRIGGAVLLLWFSRRSPDENANSPDVGCDPGFVTRAMLNAVHPANCQLIELQISALSRATNTHGMVFSQAEAAAAAELLGPGAHEEAAVALIRAVGDMKQGPASE